VELGAARAGDAVDRLDEPLAVLAEAERQVREVASRLAAALAAARTVGRRHPAASGTLRLPDAVSPPGVGEGAAEIRDAADRVVQSLEEGARLSRRLLGAAAGLEETAPRPGPGEAWAKLSSLAEELRAAAGDEQ